MWVKVIKRQFCLNRNSYNNNILNIRNSRSYTITNMSAKLDGQSNSTVDQADVQRHTKIMKDWWNPTGPMMALHSYNGLRVPFVRDGLADGLPENRTITPLKGMTILDVGCGGGILSEPLARLGAKVTGIDASKELIELATNHASLDNKLTDNMPKYICTSIEEHAETQTNTYDGVIASEIIEHVNNPELFLQSCIRTLKPGGRIFITTPNRSKLAEIAVIYIAEYILRKIPKGTHQIEKFLTPPEVTFMLERNNCHVELTYGVLYNVLTNRWSWSKYHTFAFAIQAVKLNSEDTHQK